MRTEDRNSWCGSDRGGEFSVRAISTEQFITAKISGNFLNRGIEWLITGRKHSVLQRQRSLQLQKYKVAHQNSGAKLTQIYGRHFATAKTWGCANVSSNSNQAEKVCAWISDNQGCRVGCKMSDSNLSKISDINAKIVSFLNLYILNAAIKKLYNFDAWWTA